MVIQDQVILVHEALALEAEHLVWVLVAPLIFPDPDVGGAAMDWAVTAGKALSCMLGAEVIFILAKPFFRHQVSTSLVTAGV